MTQDDGVRNCGDLDNGARMLNGQILRWAQDDGDRHCGNLDYGTCRLNGQILRCAQDDVDPEVFVNCTGSPDSHCDSTAKVLFLNDAVALRSPSPQM